MSDTAPEADRNLEPMGWTPRLVANGALIQAPTGSWSAFLGRHTSGRGRCLRRGEVTPALAAGADGGELSGADGRPV